MEHVYLTPIGSTLKISPKKANNFITYLQVVS